MMLRIVSDYERLAEHAELRAITRKPSCLSAHTYWLLAWRDCGFWNPKPAALVRTAYRQCLAKMLACLKAAA
jgi:hypothetical protein